MGNRSELLTDVPSRWLGVVINAACPAGGRLFGRLGQVLPAVSVQIHDVAGRLRRELALRGAKDIAWDGLDAHGRPAPNGIYFLSTGGTIRGRVARVH